MRFEPPYLRASLDSGSPEAVVVIDVLRVLVAEAVGVGGVGEFNLLLATEPADVEVMRSYKSPMGALRLSVVGFRFSCEGAFRRRREDSWPISPPAILLLRLESGGVVSDAELEVLSCDARVLLVGVVAPPTDDNDGVIADMDEWRCIGLTAATVTFEPERCASAFPVEGWMAELNDIAWSVSLLGRVIALGAMGDVGEEATLLAASPGLAGLVSNDLIKLWTPGEGSPRLFLSVSR